MMQDRILCVQPGFVVSEEAIQQKLEHIPDDQLECRVWARECPGITQSMTEHHALFVDTFRSFLTNGGDEETIVENLSFLSVHIRLLLVCCDYVLRRVGDVDALGWPILYISSLNASIAECFLVGMKACKSFLQLTETETDPTRSAFVDRLSAEVDKLFGQCFTLLKMYIEMVQKFFPPKADTEAGDSDVVEFVLVLDCLYDTIQLCFFDNTTTALAWKSLSLILSKHADPLLDSWVRSPALFGELSGIAMDAMLAACTLQAPALSRVSDNVKENTPPETNEDSRDKADSRRSSAEQAGKLTESAKYCEVPSEVSMAESPEYIALLENRLKVARFYFSALFRLCKPAVCAPLLVDVFNRLFEALLLLQMRMLSISSPLVRDVFIARMHKPVEQIVYHMCAHPSVLKLVLNFSADDNGQLFYAQHGSEAKLAYVVMLSQLLCVMDTLPSATHDLFLNQEHGALSAILSLWPSLYTLIGDPRMVGSSTTNTSIYTHVLTALCAHSVNLLFNGTEETFEDRIRWLEHNLFTHVLSTSFAVRYLISDWWVYLSRRWSSGTVLQHSRLLLQVAIALPRDHHVENEITALINRMMTETRDVDKRVFMKELSQMARKRPDVVVVMTRLRIVSLSDSVLGLIAHQDASAAAEAEPSGVASKADTPRTATSIESRANILSHPYSPVERSKRQQTFLQPLSGAVEVLQLKSKEAPQFDTHTNNEVQACTPIEEAKKELFCQLCRLSGYVMDVIPPEMLLKILDLLTTALDSFAASKACKWALVRCLSKLHMANKQLGDSTAKIQSHIARLYRRVLVDTDWLVWHYAVEAFREFASYTHYETLVPLLLPDESRSNVVDFINNTPFALPPTSHATHSNSPLQSIYTIDTPTDTNSQTSHHTHPRSGRTHKIATFATIRDRFVECLDIENARHEARLLPQPLQLPLPPQSDLEDDACPSDVPSVTTPNSAESKEQRKSMERETRNTKRARVDKHLSPKSPMLIDDDDDTTDTDEALLDLDEALQHLNQGLKKLKRTLSPNLRITPARKTQLVEVAQSLLTLCSGMNTK